MWQRFTERARKAVFYAQEEAQRYGESYVSTEHLLLGVLRANDPDLAPLLEGISTEEDIEAKVRLQIPQADPKPPMDMTLTPRAKRVIDLGYDEARNLNSQVIGCEHLFLGMIREGDGLAGRVLSSCGFHLEETRRRALDLPTTDTSRVPNAPFVPRPRAAELLYFRQRRYALDRLALILLADPAMVACLDSHRRCAIQSSVEELLTCAPSREDLQSPPELSALLLRAQQLAGENDLTPLHLFVAIGEHEASFLNAILKDMEIDPISLL